MLKFKQDRQTVIMIKTNSNMSELDAQFLEHVVKSLVDNPDDVKINRTVDEMGVLLTLDVNPEDMGKVIGRSGNTAKAIRTLLRVVGMKNNARVNLKINEPEGGNHPAGPDAVEPSHAMKSVDEAMEDLKI
jgi:uncharacterized protein